ncbi:MAG: saccharopine dehydrogenase NADP-binding domain-containing protein [Acidimicrobiales bacterium]
MAAPSDRPHDLVVFGATSFVGQILCRHLVARHGTTGSLRWAIAGRSAAKLDQVAAETGADVERVVVDTTDAAGLAELAASTRVLVSTVGPYALYGSAVVAACAAAGTDYADLTGETQWMRRMIDAHSTAAEASGARIVHTCGFDSIPSDLGVWFTQQRAIELLDGPCGRIDMRVVAMKGGASGGTIASMMNVVAEAAKDKEVRAILADPYALAPPDLRSGPPQPEVVAPQRDPGTGHWLGPFVMAAVNTRVVQRTHALLGRPWGPTFRYREAMDLGDGPLGAAKAGGLAAGSLAGMGLLAVEPVRGALGRWVLPKPGEGPTPEQQAAGHFDVRFSGTTASGARIATQVTGDRDPGYGSTAKMLGEAAVALLDLPRDEVGGGFWTPAAAFGDRLVERLEAHAGLRFTVLDPAT